MLIVSILLGAIAAVLILPALSDLLSIVRSMISRRQRTASTELPRLLFLVPAHNEEKLISACVASFAAMRYPADLYSVTVIADNCSDETPALARAAGASCLERHDKALPGKPRAIAWALKQLPVDSYDAVIIVDADTEVDGNFASALAGAGALKNRVLQAYFDVANPRETALTRMATVLAAANYRFAFPLKGRARLNAPLMGNGMCIGTGVLAAHGWKAFTIAEDWELYARYTAEGVSIETVEGARLYAQEAGSLEQSSTQRQRWTAGKLTVMKRHLGAIIRSTRIGFFQKLDATAELSAPGPVLHLGVVVAATALAWLLRVPGAGWLTLALWIPIARFAIYALIGLTTQPDPFRTALAFVFLPVYAAWRVVTAVSSLKMVGDKPWVRTAR